MTDKDRPSTADSRRRLPLNAFRAFEASARLGSMSAAAAELCVTHGAISRHVHALEDQFGLPLLHRLARSVAPTPEGAALASQLTEALLLMQRAAARLAPGPLTLSCSATIMMKWLIPRLNDFKRENPNVEIRLNLSHGEVDFVQDQISLAIRTSFNRAPQEILRRIVSGEFGTVMHVEVLICLNILGPSGFADPNSPHPAFTLASGAIADFLPTWRRWRTSSGPPRRSGTIRRVPRRGRRGAWDRGPGL